MEILKKIEENWCEWDIQSQNDGLLELYQFANQPVNERKEKVMLSKSLYEILIQNLRDENPIESQGLLNRKFLSIRVLIYSEIQKLNEKKTELIELLIPCLLNSNPPISDSANWLINILGIEGVERMYSENLIMGMEEKSILLGWLGRNMHVSHSKEFEDKVFAEWLAGLSNPNVKIRRSCLIALNDNSPWRVKEIRSFESSQDFQRIYPVILKALEEFELEEDDSFAYWQKFYIDAINK